MKNVKRFFAKLALYMFGVEIFSFLEEEAKNSEYKNLAPMVTSVKDFASEVPIDIWSSLRSEASKNELKIIFLKHDDKIAIAAYNLGTEFIDKKIENDFLLAPVEEAAYKLGKDIVIIYTDDNPSNKAQLQAMMRKERAPLLMASIDQGQYLINQSELDNDVKAKANFGLSVYKELIKQQANLKAA
jgi:hypothetical protein